MENTVETQEVETPEVETQEEKVELSIDDLQKQLEQLRLEKEQAIREKEVAKKSQSGSDKAVAELKARLDSLEKEKMSDEEKVKYAEQQAEKVRLEYESKLREIELDKFKSEKIADIKLESRFSSLIEGKDEISITEKTNLLTELLKAHEETINERWRAKGGKPSGGTQTQTGIDVSAMTIGQFTEYVKTLEPVEAKRAEDEYFKNRKK